MTSKDLIAALAATGVEGKVASSSVTRCGVRGDGGGDDDPSGGDAPHVGWREGCEGDEEHEGREEHEEHEADGGRDEREGLDGRGGRAGHRGDREPGER
ncbi:hypothetical protein [Corynebacterium bovis]|uniref:hypothetical protein n=1 Tax=Corynebacterium bovis TaxID=36808 RepID=UPI003CC716D5